jgi:hypothetical protein
MDRERIGCVAADEVALNRLATRGPPSHASRDFRLRQGGGG